MNEQQQKILSILASVIDRPVEEIKLEHDLRTDIELDSAQTLELLCEIEETFEVDIDEVAAAKVKTVKDLLEFAEYMATT